MTSPGTEPVRVLILGTPDDPPPGLEASGGVDVRYADTVEGIRDALVGTVVAFAWDGGRDLLEPAWNATSDLRWIQTPSAGVDRLLFPALIEGDVVVTNGRGLFEDAMAEYVLGLMIAFNRGFRATFDHMRSATWEHRDTPTLAGQRLVVVGPGPIGRAVARLARALGMRVSAVGRTARGGDADFETIAAAEDLPATLAEADHVVAATPLTEATRGLVGEAALAAMKPGAHLVNVGRGEVVDEAALVAALRENRIGGASLDVFAEEPLPPAHPLWSLPNVVVSPHMSGDAPGWGRAAVELFLDNLARWRAGRPLRNVVDKRAGHGAVEPVP